MNLKFKKTPFTVLGLLFGALLISQPLAQAAAVEKIQLALNWKPEPEFGGFYAAEAQGFYRDRNIQVEILQGGSGTPVVQMLASGKVEFGIVSADEVVMAQAHGADVVALFAVYQTNPQAIMVHASNPAKSISELFAKPGLVAMQRGLPYTDYLLRKYPSQQVKIVPYTGGLSQFIKDPQFSQQCFVTSEPIEAKKSGVETRSFLIADEGYNPYTTVLATRRAVMKKNPQLVKAVVEATRAGWLDYLKHPEKTNGAMASLNKAMDAATFAAAAEAQKKLIIPADSAVAVGSMSRDRWQTLIQQLTDLKVVDKKLEPSEMFN